MAPNPFLLIDILAQVYENPAYKPSNGKTFCNMAAMDIMQQYGYNTIPPGLVANQLFDFMTKDSSWSEVGMEQCQLLANRGTLVYAVQKGTPHGHICVIRPGMEKYSSNWNKMAPSCMNVGKENFIAKTVNFAFQTMPKFFMWKQSIGGA